MKTTRLFSAALAILMSVCLWSCDSDKDNTHPAPTTPTPQNKVYFSNSALDVEEATYQAVQNDYVFEMKGSNEETAFSIKITYPGALAFGVKHDVIADNISVLGEYWMLNLSPGVDGGSKWFATPTTRANYEEISSGEVTIVKMADDKVNVKFTFNKDGIRGEAVASCPNHI